MTASKAREKKLTKLAAQGLKIPVPLRSQQKPMGLDKLSGLDKVRTETANHVYEATAAIMRACLELDIVCSVENPENSLFWFYPDIEKVIQLAKGHSVSFHNCMHGGSRNKLTKWWATKNVYESLRSFCDNKHKHAAWNPQPVGTKLTFPTASEAAYPFLLCKRVMALVLSYALEEGALNPDTLQAQLPQTANTSHRWILDMLPKGKKLRPLVSEFKGYAFSWLAHLKSLKIVFSSSSSSKVQESYNDRCSGVECGSWSIRANKIFFGLTTKANNTTLDVSKRWLKMESWK